MAEFTSYREGVPSWTDLMAADVAGARAFYGSLLGWEFVDGPPETGGYAICTLRGKAVAGLGGQNPDAPPQVVWTTYFATDAVEATIAKITANGGAVLMGPMDVMDQGRMAIAQDPTGAVFGLWQAGAMTGAQLANEPGSMSWNELMTRDLEAAKRFYAAVFGYEYEAVDPDGMRYEVFSTPGHGQTGGMMEAPADLPAEVPPHWNVYFSVEDVDAAVATVNGAGGRVLFGPDDTPYGRMAAVMDPQGATFTVIRPPAAQG